MPSLNHDRRSIPAAGQGWIAHLRRFAQAPLAPELCDLCSARIFSPHRHLLESATRRLLCCCQPCAILFSDNPGGKYRRVPEQAWMLTDFHMTEAQWDALEIPIGMAFFVRNSALDRVLAFYPSPAGVIESLLNLEAWESLAQENPVLSMLEADVEALLVNRIAAGNGYYRVPVDRCYELVGLIRARWQGISGGSMVHSELHDFFARLDNSETQSECSYARPDS